MSFSLLMLAKYYMEIKNSKKSKKEEKSFFSIKTLNELEQYIKDKGINNITSFEWNHFCTCDFFRNTETIKKYSKYIDWEYFTIFRPSDALVEAFKTKLNWLDISLSWDLSLDFIKKYKKYLKPALLELNPHLESLDNEIHEIFKNEKMILTRADAKKILKRQTTTNEKKEAPVKEKTSDTPVVKRGRGRPPKNEKIEVIEPKKEEIKRGRGRPKKNETLQKK